MKILHTSDWHLGRTLYGRRCSSEFKAFLDWMILTIEEQRADCLLIAGDIFDTSTPGNTMQSLYYSFLYRVSQTCCRHICIIGGNHDSPSLLDAPRQLLTQLNVNVVGSISEDPGEEVITITDSSGKAAMLVCAVPFLRDRDIRRAEPGESMEEKAGKLIEGIARHYHEVIDIARQRKKNLGNHIPLVAMGHLFTAGGRVTSDTNEIRDLYIGSLAHFPSSLFPASIDYLALGHLHIAQQVQQSDTIRYSGSPLQLSFAKENREKSITAVTFSNGTMELETIPVPRFLRLETITGNREEILAGLDALIAEGGRMMLEVIYTGENISSLREDLEESIRDTGIELLRTVNRGLLPQLLQQHSPLETLEELSTIEVFRRCCDAHDVAGEGREELESCFTEILQSLAEDEDEEQAP